MGRGKNKRSKNKPAFHHESCVCSRCLDVDTTQLEKELDKQWEKFNRENLLQAAHIHLTVKESPVIGPYDGADVAKALYVTCPMAIVGTIVPRSRRRK